MFDVPECVKIRNRKMRAPVAGKNPRGSPQVRLISSLAMLVLAIGGVWFYSVRKTNELLDIGVNGHLHCAIADTYPRQTQRAEMAEALGVQFAPMLQPLLDADGVDEAISAHRCTAAGRAYIHIILRPGQTLVSVILTQRGDQEVFPRALAGRVVRAAGIQLHEGTRDGYSVAAFESGRYLAYIVSALPGRQNSELASRLAPVIDRYTKN
jgi:hypothetical protein